MQSDERPPNIYVAVIDDDESFRRSLARLLVAADYHPVTYDSAEAFLSDRSRPRFGCLLLDIRLGGISGLELQRRLRSVGSTTPVVYTSAYDDAITREEARTVGCAAFVSKLEPIDALLGALRLALGSPPP